MPAPTQSSQADKDREMEVRRRATLAFIGENRNKNTASTYASGWKRFQGYMDKVGVTGKEVTEVEVAAFLQERYQKDGVKASTLQADRAAIADGLKLFKNEATTGTMVGAMMAVLVTKAVPSIAKRHMSLDLMRDVLQTLEKEGVVDAAIANTAGLRQAFLARRNACLLLVMLLGMLRASEAVVLTDENVVLSVEKGVTILSLFIRRSKGSCA